jgi:hypothetical protein
MSIEMFKSSRAAYDASQCRLQKGIILVVESESAVAISYTWPVAVTVELGQEFHGVVPGYVEEFVTKESLLPYVVEAVAAARTRGYEVGSEWAALAEELQS